MRKTLHAILTGALLLIFIGISLPFLIPMDAYRPALESQLSYATGHHIMIDSLRLRMLPSPELSAKGVTLWAKDAGGDELHIQNMRIDPDLARLIFDKALVIRRVHVSGLQTSEEFVAALRQRLASAPSTSRSAPALLSIEQVSGSAVRFATAGGKVLGPYEINLIFGTDHVPNKVDLARSDGRLDVRLERAKTAGYDVQLRASDWTLPIGPALRFDRLDATARAVDGALDIAHIRAEAYDGTAEGKGRLSWSDHWRLEGKVRAASLSMAPIVHLFGGGGFNGRFGGDLALHFKADTPARLFAHPLVSGTVRIRDGVVATAGRDRPWFEFDRLEGRAIVNRMGLVTKETRLEAYGGVVEGDTATTWTQGWAVDATLSASSVDTGRLLEGFLDRPVLDGSFEGQADLTLASENFLTLFDNPSIAGHFRLTDGVIFQADLKEASTNMSKDGTTGGQTDFASLSGRAVIQDGNVRLAELEMASTALKADGHLTIDKGDRLSGKLDVGVRNTASLISIPILVQGTTKEPRLRPTSSAMIGGMVGTSVLGPGVGTAVGIKIGKFVDAIGSAIAGDGED